MERKRGQPHRSEIFKVSKDPAWVDQAEMVA